MGLDEIKDVAKDFADKAVTKTGEVVEVSKLRLELSKQQGRLRALYQKLGSSVYSMKEKEYEDPDLIDHLCQEIKANLKIQRDLKVKIAGLKKMKVCPVCGQPQPHGKRLLQPVWFSDERGLCSAGRRTCAG